MKQGILEKWMHMTTLEKMYALLELDKEAINELLLQVGESERIQILSNPFLSCIINDRMKMNE